MRDFSQPGSFDFALSMFTSFGYFDDRAEDMTVLRNIFASLRSGGVLLIDVMGKEILAAGLLETTTDTLPDGRMLVQRHEIFDDWTRIRNEWIIIGDGPSRHFHFHHTIYSGQELRARLQQAGFVDVKLYGNLDGDSYGTNTQRLITVGTKP